MHVTDQELEEYLFIHVLGWSKSNTDDGVVWLDDEQKSVNKLGIFNPVHSFADAWQLALTLSLRYHIILEPRHNAAVCRLMRLPQTPELAHNLQDAYVSVNDPKPSRALCKAIAKAYGMNMI